MMSSNSIAERIVILGADQMALWDSFVKSHDAGTLYHTAAWRNVIQSVYGHAPLYFALLDGNGKIQAGIPVFLVRSRLTGIRLSTLPCAHSCDPLVNEATHYQALKQSIQKYMRAENIKSWQMKTTHGFLFEASACIPPNNGYITHVLRIDRPVNDIYDGFHKSQIHRSIKKAMRYNLQLKRCESREAVQTFYRLYLHMRRQEGLLPQPKSFFEGLWDRFHSENRIDILYAEYRGHIISTLILLKYKNTVVYEYGATEKGAHHYCPSSFLLWNAIREAAEEGYAIFDFGRTAESEESLANFKDHWGAQRQPLRYYEMGIAPGIASIRKSGRAKQLMGFTMRHMPDTVCHLAGKALYGHLL
jgi:CelD/BcsL family acetyltransferase involved in cellulose biosynthesis